MKAAKKAVAKKQSSPLAPPASAQAAAGVASARAALDTIGARESVTIDARTAVLVALTDMTGLVTFTNGVISPFNLFKLTFDNDKVGLGDGQMPLLYGKVSTAIGNQRVDALIQKNLTSSPSASVVINDVTDLIQLWIDNPSLTA